MNIGRATEYRNTSAIHRRKLDENCVGGRVPNALEWRRRRE